MAHPATISLLSLCLSGTLRLRIASGGYDCRRECALHPGTVPLTSNHSCRKIGCLDGLCIGAQPLRGRHTPSRHHVVFRLPSVTCLHYGKPSDNIIIRTTASSDLQVLPGTKTVRSLHCIPLASSSHAASIIPPLVTRSVNTLSYPQPQAPSSAEGAVLEAMSTMAAAFESLTAAGTERECALLTGTATLDIQSLACERLPVRRSAVSVSTFQDSTHSLLAQSTSFTTPPRLR